MSTKRRIDTLFLVHSIMAGITGGLAFVLPHLFEWFMIHHGEKFSLRDNSDASQKVTHLVTRRVARHARGGAAPRRERGAPPLGIRVPLRGGGRRPAAPRAKQPGRWAHAHPRALVRSPSSLAHPPHRPPPPPPPPPSPARTGCTAR